MNMHRLNGPLLVLGLAALGFGLYLQKAPQNFSQEADQAQASQEVVNSIYQMAPEFGACQDELQGDRWSSRLKENLPVCFRSFSSPWSVNLKVIFRNGKLYLTEFENAEIFWADSKSIRSCIENLIVDESTGVDREFGGRRLSEFSEYRVEKISEEKPTQVISKSGCVQLTEDPYIRQPKNRSSSEIRDVGVLVGSSGEQDDVTLSLLSCDSLLSEKVRKQSMLVKFGLVWNSRNEATYTFEDKDKVSEGLPETYFRCVANALSVRLNQSSVATPDVKMVVETSDGKKVEMKGEATTSTRKEIQWYFRQAAKKPKFYLPKYLEI